VRKISWNFKRVTSLVASCLLGGLVLFGTDYLLTTADVDNPFWYSFSKAMVITFVLTFNNMLFGVSPTENKKRNLFIRLALAIVVLTAIDLLVWS